MQGVQEEAPAALEERFGLPDPAGQLDRLAWLAFAEQPAGQGIGRADEEATEAVALAIGPLLKLGATRSGEPREEVSGVALHRFREGAGFDSGQEQIAVGFDGKGEVDLLASLEGRFAEELAELPEGLAQGVAAAVAGHVGPEEVEQVFPAGGASGREGQVGQEGERFAGAQ